MINAKINTLIEAINASSSPHKNDEIQIINDFINDCGVYIEKVTAMEAAMATERFRLALGLPEADHAPEPQPQADPRRTDRLC